MRSASVVLSVVFAAALAACPPPSDKQKPASDGASACAKIGQNCEVSPGKLGTCVMKHGCTELSPTCFVCQSQH